MRVLSITSASGGCAAAVLDGAAVAAEGRVAGEVGLAAALPVLVQALLDRAGRSLGLVAVTVGPGSFTGLRAGLSVAAGVGLALGIPVVGATLAESFAAGADGLDGRALWTAVHARRGRVFVDAGAGFAGHATDALPAARGRVAVCGNAANPVAAALAARGTDVMLTSWRAARPQDVAAVALRRLSGALPPLPAEPLYVDAPEARLPAGGLRGLPA